MPRTGGRASRSADEPMPRTKKEIVTEFRTAEILQAANRVFAERGFDQATIAEIAKTAGVAKGTIYLYYRSKREVYWAAVHRHSRELQAETARAISAAESIEKKLQAFISTELRYFDQHPEFCRIYLAECGRSALRHGHFQRQADELYLEQAHHLDGLLQEGVRRRLVRPVRTAAAALAILDITRGVTTQRLRGWSRAPLEEDIAAAFELTWKGLMHR